MFWLNLKSVVKSLLKAAKEEARTLPHLGLTVLLVTFASFWWVLKRQTATKRIAEVREEQAKLEREYSKAVSKAVGMHESERQKLNEHYKKEIEELNEVDRKIDEAVDKGPVGIASAWAEHLGVKK